MMGNVLQFQGGHQRPESDRDQTEVRQRSDRGQTEVRQRSDRGQTEVRQRSDRGQTEIGWRLVRDQREVQVWSDSIVRRIEEHNNQIVLY